MKKLTIIALMLTCISGYSQPKIVVTKNKTYFNDGAYLKPGGEIAKDWVQCRLIEVRKTMRGMKHTFVTDSSGILTRYLYQPLAVDSCYFVNFKTH